MNQYRAKGIVIIIVFILGALVGRWSVGETKYPKLETSDVWCFYAEYSDMDSMRAVKSPSEAFIDIGAGGRVRVFERCSVIYEEEE